MGQRSEVPTRAERAAQAAKMRAGLPPVRHAIQMRCDLLFGEWRVTLSDRGSLLRECRFGDEQRLKIKEMARRGRGLTCLADKQALEYGLRTGSGIVPLELDADQYASLLNPQ